MSLAVRFWHRLNAMTAHYCGLARTFRPLLENTFFSARTLRFVAAGMRRRKDVLLPHGKLVVRTIRQLLDKLSRHKWITFIVAGVVGLALVLLLLEINFRMEVAKEASDPPTGVIPRPFASDQLPEFAAAFPIQATTPISLQSVDQPEASGPTPSLDYAQTFGQAFRESVPLPRPRKSRSRHQAAGLERSQSSPRTPMSW
jgi:hypothetical protein